MTLGQNPDTLSGHKQSLCKVKGSNVPTVHKKDFRHAQLQTGMQTVSHYSFEL